jgi:hypothetical protein
MGGLHIRYQAIAANVTAYDGRGRRYPEAKRVEALTRWKNLILSKSRLLQLTYIEDSIYIYVDC